MIVRLFTSLGILMRGALSALACLSATVLAAPMNAQEALLPQPWPSPEEGGPRRLEVTGAATLLFLDPSDASESVTRLDPNSVVSNLGCDEGVGQVWCHVAAGAGRPTGFVKASEVIPAVGPDGVVPMGVDDSRRRAGQGDYDATGRIACAQNEGESLGRCTASIARSGGGDATIVATFGNNFSRELYFTHGAFTRANATMSGVGRDTDWEVQDGIYRIRVDDQRFEIDAAFVLGE